MKSLSFTVLFSKAFIAFSALRASSPMSSVSFHSDESLSPHDKKTVNSQLISISYNSPDKIPSEGSTGGASGRHSASAAPPRSSPRKRPASTSRATSNPSTQRPSKKQRTDSDTSKKKDIEAAEPIPLAEFEPLPSTVRREPSPGVFPAVSSSLDASGYIMNPNFNPNYFGRSPSKSQLSAAQSQLHSQLSVDSFAAPTSTEVNPSSDSNPFFDDPYDFEEIRGRYRILQKIGTFSIVYKAVSLSQPQTVVALKRIRKTSSPARIERELKFLIDLKGQEYVVPFLGGLRHRDQITIALAFCQHLSFRDYYIHMNEEEIRDYMSALLKSLAHLASLQIIHRDIKPSNFLYNRDRNQYMLVDFGLAQYVHEVATPKPTDSQEAKSKTAKTLSNTEWDNVIGVNSTVVAKSLRGVSGKKESLDSQDVSNELKTQRAPRAGTRGFRSPEVLLRSHYQNCAIDVWSAGVTMLSILSGRYPFFEASDDLVALAELICIFGSDEISKVARALGKRLTVAVHCRKYDLALICKRLRFCYPLPVSDACYDLLNRLLDVNPFTRITAAEALNHSFFQPPKK